MNVTWMDRRTWISHCFRRHSQKCRLLPGGDRHPLGAMDVALRVTGQFVLLHLGLFFYVHELVAKPHNQNGQDLFSGVHCWNSHVFFEVRRCYTKKKKVKGNNQLVNERLYKCSVCHFSFGGISPMWFWAVVAETVTVSSFELKLF